MWSVRFSLCSDGSLNSQYSQKTAAPRDYLDFAAFQEFVKLLKRRDEVELVFREIVGAAGAFTEETWTKFLRESQKVRLFSSDPLAAR